MDYTSLIYFFGRYFPVLTMVFFTIKLVGGESRDRKHSFVICILCVLYFFTPELDESLSKELYDAAYIKALHIITLINGFGMMIMFYAAIYDKTAFKHAAILALMILINTMLIYHHTVSPMQFFNGYYIELSIVLSALQIMVSVDGITNSVSRIVGFFSSVQGVVGWAFFSCLCLLGNIQEYFKGAKRT